MRWPLAFRNARRNSRAANTFGFAVVGLGHGADKFLEALRASPSVSIRALVSGNRSKADRLARAFGIPAVYTYAHFDRIAENPQIQAVYLCLPNHLHRQYTERAVQAGKHVLCEKPMAPSVADCRAMIEACERAKRLLAVGYRLPFTSVHRRLRDLVHGGSMGEITAVRSGFGFRATSGWRLDTDQAGAGSLFDVGVYPINMLHWLFPEGFSPEQASMQYDRGSRLELATEWKGHLNVGGAPIECRSSFLEKIPDFFQIETTRARMVLQPAFSYSGLQLQVRAHATSDKRLDFVYRTPRNEPAAFRLEAEHLAHCAQTGAPLENPGEVGLRDVETIESLFTLARH